MKGLRHSHLPSYHGAPWLTLSETMWDGPSGIRLAFGGGNTENYHPFQGESGEGGVPENLREGLPGVSV